MKMSKTIQLLGICILALSLTGCESLKGKNQGVIGKSVKAEEKARDRVVDVNDAIVANDRQKLDTIGVFAAGTEYSLAKIQNPPKEVEVAREMNSRVMTLANPAALEKLKESHKIVDNLLSAIQTDIENGKKTLAKRDTDIYDIQSDRKSFDTAKEEELKRYMSVAKAAAGKADQYAATLGSMDSWWGLGAVGYGVKRFLTKSITFISIFFVLYLVLRILAPMNPVAGAIFSIFDIMFSFVISLIKGIAPGAAKMAKLVPEAAHTLYQETLGHVVDTIELLRVEDKKAVASGQPLKKYTIEEILTMFKGSMDQAHKDIIDEVKVDQNWK